MNHLNLTNDLGELNVSGMILAKPTCDPAPAGTPTLSEPVWGIFSHMDDVTQFRAIATVVPSDDERCCVYVQNLDDPNLNFYLGSRWSDLELDRAGIFGTVTVS